MIKTLETILIRAASWPELAQAELARAARDIELEHSGQVYKLSAGEHAAINEGLAQADRGEFVPDDEMEAFFARREP